MTTKPVKLLRCTLSGVSVNATSTVNGASVASKWNATLTAVAQAHSDASTPTPYFYNGNDIKVGDFITTSGDGKSLKVSSITTKSANSVVCVLEDDQNANALSDETGNLDGMIPNGVGITGFIFEVNNNVPVIASIPTAMPGNIPVTFAQNIKSRFENIYGASNLFSSSLLKFGDSTAGDQMLTVQTNASYAHKLGVKGGKWQLTNDGSTYTEIALRASTLAGYGITDAIPASQKGATSGVATLDSTGKIPASQLPSFVDDVLEFANLAGFPASGETGKIYLALDTGSIYRWSGSTYIQINTGVGSSDTATKLTTARTIGMTGDVTWTSGAFDGTANVTGTATLTNSGVTAGSYAKVTVDAKGRVTAGGSLAASDVPSLDWAKITTGKPTTLAGYGIADAFTKTETTAAINAASKQFSFTMAFVGSNPSTTAPSDLPAGWTYAVSGSDVTITHTVGKPLATISYWGVSSTGGVQRYRLPSASNEVTIPTANANSQFVFRISTAVAGADTDGTARIVMSF